MALMKPDFKLVWKEFWKGEGRFEQKSIPFGVSAPYSNKGAADKAHFTWLSKPEQKKHYEMLYEEYSRQHPFTPSMMARKNPALQKLEMEQWAKKCHAYCLTNEPKIFSEMLYKGSYGQHADKKPRQGATLSSSWVKGMRIISQSQIQLKLGSKYYTYDCSKGAQEKLMQLQSVGAEVAKARNDRSMYLKRIPGYSK